MPKTPTPKTTLIITGAKITQDPSEINTGPLSEIYRDDVDIYSVSQDRDSQETKVPLGASDVFEIKFNDGAEWILSSDHLDEVFVGKEDEDGNVEYNINNLQNVDDNRGGKGIFVKLFRHIFKKKKKKLINKLTGTALDSLLVKKEGLFSVNDNFHLTSFIPNKSAKKYLVLIHGFVASFKQTFGGLEEDNQILFNDMRTMYDGNILAFNHHTIMKSPIENAIDLLKALPDNCKIDILSSSRGGLIADLITHFSEGHDFSRDTYTSKISDANQKSLLAKFVKLAKKKNISVGRLVRVACPANGTTLLSQRLDIFLNLVLNGIGLLIGGPANLIYSRLKGFLLNVVESKHDVTVFPGLAAMKPGSDFQKMLNSLEECQGELYMLLGDSIIGKRIFRSIKIVLGDLLHADKKNDFVVNTESMLMGAKRDRDIYAFLSRTTETSHFKYYKNEDSRLAIKNALEAEKGETPQRFQLITEAERNDDPALVVLDRSGDDAEQVDLIDILFGNLEDEDSVSLNISLSYGHLRYADHPILLGHFSHDGIVSAEAVLDNELNGKLTRRYDLKLYPNSIGESLVLFNRDKNQFKRPKGGIIVGLGEVANFNEYALRKTVEKGVLQYAIYLKEHKDFLNEKEENDKGINANSISSLCIGSSYAGLNMKQALIAIIIGINKANNKIRIHNTAIKNSYTAENDETELLTQIENVELIEIYEDQMLDAFYALQDIKKYQSQLNIIPPTIFKDKAGKRKRQTRSYGNYWWYEVTIRHSDYRKDMHEDSEDDNDQFEFIISKKRAKVDDREELYPAGFIKNILSELNKNNSSDQNSWNTLFQLITPNEVKSIFRDQRNVILRLDKKAAELPWEMLYDHKDEDEPSFINTGIIRQLISQSQDSLEAVVRKSRSALIIGDPIYEKYSQLPYAKLEAEKLNDKLKSHGWQDVHLSVNAKPIEILNSLFNREYKILHISGHGVYNPKGKSGIVLGNDIMDAVVLQKFNNVPEFVFINCCNSGSIDSKHEELFRDRNQLAASVGVQLIEMGVSAVIITGWAVNDKAAEIFADKFYTHMLNGDSFGLATQKARKEVYNNSHSYTDTWGAYQCYGDPWYRFETRRSQQNNDDEYLLEQDALIELFNFKNEISHSNKENNKKILKKIDGLIDAEKKFRSTLILEGIAQLYSELDLPEKVIEFYKRLMNSDDTRFTAKSIEQYVHYQIKDAVRTKLDVEKAEQFAHTLMLIIKFGKSSERYSLVGSAFKRLIILASEEKDISDYIIQMNNAYKNAFEISNKEDIRKYSYSFFNFAIGSLFSPNIPQNKLHEKYRLPQKKEIKKWKEDSDQLIISDNFFDYIIKINYKIYDLLKATNRGNINTDIKIIIKDYVDAYQFKGSPKVLRSEIEQTKFLLTVISKSQITAKRAKMDALHKFKLELTKLEKTK